MGKHELRGEHGPELIIGEDGEPYALVKEGAMGRTYVPLDEDDYPEVGGAGVPFGTVTEPGGIAAGESGTVRLGGGFPVPELHQDQSVTETKIQRLPRNRAQADLYRHGLDKAIRQPKVEPNEFRCPTCSSSAFMEREDDLGVLIYHRGRYFPCRAPEGYVRLRDEKGEPIDG